MAPVKGLPAGEDDWYLHLLWVDRRKCLLMTHAGTLFSVFVPGVRASELRLLAPLVARTVTERLRLEGLPLDVLGPLDPVAARVALTADRSVLGYVNQIAFNCRYQIDRAGGLDAVDLAGLNGWLLRMLHSRDGYTTPLDLIAHRQGEE